MIVKKHIVRFLTKVRKGRKIVEDKVFIAVNLLSQKETAKKPRRTEIINYFVSLTDQKYYLEIGVRDPRKNFLRINCENKFSVDPGVEFIENPVDFKMTSDDFFRKINDNKIEKLIDKKFDVIFIDGLHISNQVEKDIQNSLKLIKEDGFIILHDCNPPSEYHQREDYEFVNSPAGPFWNGTTWKAFYKFRYESELYSICFDSDWGVGVISKRKLPLFNNLERPIKNEFYEFKFLNDNRTDSLNLHLFEVWKQKIKK
ncbi:MAG: SAM-dependent methyltransferase [Flavobacterium sp.]|jgi:SAM-dependent methyltransferase